MVGRLVLGEEALPQPQRADHPGLDAQFFPDLPEQGLFQGFMQAHPAPGQVVEPAAILLVVDAQKPAIAHNDRPHPEVEAALGR